MRSKSRIPTLNTLKEDLYLVVEGEIDYLFINKIISFIPNKYNVRIRVANGNGNIPIHVNILRKVYSYSKIVVLHDLDGNFTLNDIKRFLKNKEVELKDEDIYFVNPCIEFLMILTKELNNEKFTHKKDYRFYINKYFNITEYSGHIPQAENIIKQLTKEDFNNFVNNLQLISKNDLDLPSSNFIYFLTRIKK